VALPVPRTARGAALRVLEQDRIVLEGLPDDARDTNPLPARSRITVCAAGSKRSRANRSKPRKPLRRRPETASRPKRDGAGRENVPDARYSVHSLELGLRILESFDRTRSTK